MRSTEESRDVEGGRQEGSIPSVAVAAAVVGAPVVAVALAAGLAASAVAAALAPTADDRPRPHQVIESMDERSWLV